ncbi:MmgE/PrpD family protein, partial [Candidatus Bathyarchaeota archaeon]|nr:MmgE/PrpD family protein [Candidatus Bathyarchaeota archaeon]
MTSITTDIVGFLLRAGSPPSDVERKAIEHVTDGIGLMLAGARTECSKKLAEFVCAEGGASTSTLVGFSFKASPSNAALVNGASGHVDDYDDTQLSTSLDRIYGLLTHPTTPVLAAALAVGEKTACSGRDFLEAFIAGFEVECKLAEAMNPEHYRRGFHTTGTIGAFGACAASGKLLGLVEEELRHALGITASLSSGIRANFGTMTKPLHAGRAASNGVTACLLAKRGFTADEDSLDGRWGFLSILGHGVDHEKIVGKLGNPYTLMHPGASIKMYPCGSLGQPSMDAFLEIVQEEELRPEDVREIRLRAGPSILEPL